MMENPGYENCAHACHECQDACLRTIIHCLDLGKEHAARPHQTMLTDCAAVCALTHDFLHRQSPHAVHFCAECAEICSACAYGCEQLGKDDPVMSRCSESCRNCAAACTRLTGAI